jgi:hemin uptake protein HemP
MQTSAIRLCYLGLAMFCGAFSVSQSGPQKVLLLSPGRIPGLPVQVRTELERLGCEIPQNTASKAPNNVVSGTFSKVGQRDWAALCAHGDRMRVVVAWGGRSSCSAEPTDRIDPIANVWSQQQDNSFETYVISAPPKRILSFREFFGDDHKSAVTHDGIEYGGGNAPVIY